MSQPDKTNLVARDLTLSYDGTSIVENLNLDIPQGVFTALLGPNGSGKSTILRALGGLLMPAAGGVALDGRPLREFSTRQLARRISILPQNPSAPEGLTVRDLVRQGRYPHRSFFSQWSEGDEAACSRALDMTAMTELADRPLERLSGGQRQRAWIAMTLAQETDILLLDEPTTFLDLAHQIEVMELVSRLTRESAKTVVAVLHDLNQSARHADHIVLLAGGRIAGAGRPDEVITGENIGQVFGVRVAIVPDPLTGSPMCLPVPRPKDAGM